MISFYSARNKNKVNNYDDQITKNVLKGLMI